MLGGYFKYWIDTPLCQASVLRRPGLDQHAEHGATSCTSGGRPSTNLQPKVSYSQTSLQYIGLLFLVGERPGRWFQFRVYRRGTFWPQHRVSEERVPQLLLFLAVLQSRKYFVRLRLRGSVNPAPPPTLTFLWPLDFFFLSQIVLLDTLNDYLLWLHLNTFLSGLMHVFPFLSKLPSRAQSLLDQFFLMNTFVHFLSDGERCRQRKEFKNLPYIGFTFTSDKGKVQALEFKVSLFVLKYCLLFFGTYKTIWAHQVRGELCSDFITVQNSMIYTYAY